MAAITLLLLWLFQFIIFDVLYYDRQEAHIKSISAEFLEQDYSKPDSWKSFDATAKNQNVNIYVFDFNVNNVTQDNNGSYVFPDSLNLKIYTPYYTNQNAPISSLDWTASRISHFLSTIKSGETSFTYYEDFNEESIANTLIYGGELKGNMASNSKYYFCVVASVSSSNYATMLMQNLLIVASISILAITVVMALVFSRRLSRPINKLANTANLLARGNFDVSFESESCNEVKQLAASLNFAKEELSKTDQMRRDFIANVSHDLRTPLTMIQAYAEMIRDLSGNIPEKRTKHCQIIIDETKRLSLLVGDIQNLSKLQSGTESITSKPFDIAELCKTVVKRFSIMSETQGYYFVVECGTSAVVNGDYQKIEQVLYNLIGNALNYTGEDKKVRIRCIEKVSSFRIEITDTGKGIAKEDIDQVWDRYYRINQKKRNVVGSGLGLNIVKAILDNHKAEYGIESEVNVGTTFWFELKKVQA